MLLLGCAVAVLFHRILLRQAFLWGDFLVQGYPFRSFAAAALAEGELPLWNPFAFAGMPFQADIQTAVFYLPNLMLTPFVRDGRLPFYPFELLVIAHYWIAAITMYWLARDHWLERPYAAFAAMAYALSGFMIVRAFQQGFVEELAWLPLILLCLGRAIDRRSLPYAIGGGLVFGNAILAGAPQITLYLAMMVVAFTVFRLVEPTGTPRREIVRVGVVAIVVALGVASIQLLPTAELGRLSERPEMSLAASQEYRLEWRQLITVLVPRLYGYAGGIHATYWVPARYGTYWETCFYWGLAALASASAAVVFCPRDRLVRFLATIVVASVLLAVGDRFILQPLFYHAAPGFSKFRAMARSMCMATFAVALLSGIGLRALVQIRADSPRRVENFALVVAAVPVTIWAAIRMGALLPRDHAAYLAIRGFATDEARFSVLFAGGFALLLGLLVRGVIPGRIAIAGVFLLQFADMFRFGWRQNDGSVDGDVYYTALAPTQREVIDRLKQLAVHEQFRITARGQGDGPAMLDRHQGLIDRLQFTDGFNPLRLARLVPPAPTRDATLDLLGSRFRLWPSPTNLIDVVESSTRLPRAWLVHAARVIPDDSTAARFMRNREFDPRRTVVLASDPGLPLPPDAEPSDSSVRVTSYGLNRMTLRAVAPRAGIVVLSEIHYPGWSATVNGVPAPVIRADWNLRGIPVAPGVHEIQLRFVPRSFTIGAAITLATLLLSLLSLIRRVHGPHAPSPTP